MNFLKVLYLRFFSPSVQKTMAKWQSTIDELEQVSVFHLAQNAEKVAKAEALKLEAAAHDTEAKMAQTVKGKLEKLFE